MSAISLLTIDMMSNVSESFHRSISFPSQVNNTAVVAKATAPSPNLSPTPPERSGPFRISKKISKLSFKLNKWGASATWVKAKDKRNIPTGCLINTFIFNVLMLWTTWSCLQVDWSGVVFMTAQFTNRTVHIYQEGGWHTKKQHITELWYIRKLHYTGKLQYTRKLQHIKKLHYTGKLLCQKAAAYQEAAVHKMCD